MLYHGSAGAGILFICEDKVLLTLRSDEVREPGTWGIPGGSVADDGPYSPEEPSRAKPPLFQSWEGAKRESQEELGSIPPGLRFSGTVIYEDGNFTYVTFLVRIHPKNKNRWKFQLNWENDEAAWFPTNSLPAPLHFGFAYVVNNMPEIFD